MSRASEKSISRFSPVQHARRPHRRRSLPAVVPGCFFINVTATSATPSVVFTIDGQDPISGAAYNILTSAAITATGLTVLRVHPALSAAANTIAKDMLPAAVKVTATHADSDSITYSVSFIGVD